MRQWGRPAKPLPVFRHTLSKISHRISLSPDILLFLQSKLLKMTTAEYISEIQKRFATGVAREHAYRPALQNLLATLLPDDNYGDKLSILMKVCV
jgi:hypothetical protein